jgi:hypothetical protein
LQSPSRSYQSILTPEQLSLLEASPGSEPLARLESQVDWKEALSFPKEIKHQMQFNYQRTGRGRPHIEWRW